MIDTLKYERPLHLCAEIRASVFEAYFLPLSFRTSKIKHFFQLRKLHKKIRNQNITAKSPHKFEMEFLLDKKRNIFLFVRAIFDGRPAKRHRITICGGFRHFVLQAQRIRAVEARANAGEICAQGRPDAINLPLNPHGYSAYLESRPFATVR